MNLDFNVLHRRKLKLMILVAILTIVLLTLLTISIVFWNDYNTLIYIDLIIFIFSFVLLTFICFFIFIITKDIKVKEKILKEKSICISNVRFTSLEYKEITTDRMPCYQYDVIIDDVPTQIYCLGILENISLTKIYELKQSGRYIIGVSDE